MDMDISFKIGIGLAAALGSAALVVVPNARQRDAAAVNLFERPFRDLTPQEAKVAEFQAGYKRWHDFFDKRVYPITRQLPGASTPFVNPYREGAAAAARPQPMEE